MEEIKGTSKIAAAKERIKKLAENNHTLRVIAEKITTYRYLELSDEFKSLKVVIRTLKELGYTWTYQQIRLAVKWCFDPRYYTRYDIADIYEIAGIEVKKTPSIPNWWGGVTEWSTGVGGWIKERKGSDDLPKEKYEFFRERG